MDACAPSWLERQERLRSEELAQPGDGWTQIVPVPKSIQPNYCEFKHERAYRCSRLLPPLLKKAACRVNAIPPLMFVVRRRERLCCFHGPQPSYLFLPQLEPHHRTSSLHLPSTLYNILPLDIALEVVEHVRCTNREICRLSPNASWLIDTSLPQAYRKPGRYRDLKRLSLCTLDRVSDRIQLTGGYLSFIGRVFASTVERDHRPEPSPECVSKQSLSVNESIRSPFASKQLPGTMVITFTVFGSYPQLVQEFAGRGHEIIDRPSYDGRHWIYTKDKRYVITESAESIRGIRNAHIILLASDGMLSRGCVESLLETPDVYIHHCSTLFDLADLVEANGLQKTGAANVETAWERFCAIHSKDLFNPLADSFSFRQCTD